MKVIDDGSNFTDGLGDLAGRGLNGFNAGADLFGGFGGFLGEVFYLAGDDGEAFACRAGAGGLDGGIEGEEVGLFGDGGDDAEDGADFLIGGIEFLHGVIGLGGEVSGVLGD